MQSIRKRLTFSNVIACMALFVALGGASYAAVNLPKNSVGTKQIKKNAVTTAKIKKEAVAAGKIKLGPVTEAKLATGSVSATSAVTANGDSTGVTATCPGDERVIAGGFETENVGAAKWVVKRLLQTGNGWRVFGVNESGGNSTIIAFAYCLAE